MNPNQTEAYKYLAQAQQARKAGDKRLARQYAEQAARLAPELEDVWLMMGALASPRASVAFMEKALQINPESERVRQGMNWAVERLRKEPPRPPVAAQPTPAPVEKPAGKPHISFMAILLTAMCLVVLASAVLAAPSMASAFAASPMLIGGQNTPSQATAQIAKPTRTPAPSATPTPNPERTGVSESGQAPIEPGQAEGPALSAIEGSAPSPTVVPTETISPTFTTPPTETDAPTATNTSSPFPTETPTVIPTPTPNPESAAPDPESAGASDPEQADSADPSPTPLPTDTTAPLATRYVPPPVSGAGSGVHWIDVDLTNQMVYAYEGDTIVNSFVTSTGTWQYPTVTGQYRVYVKFRYKHMSGPGYSLPNVPYTMFFYQGYAIHGTYWHSNFGTPMSHGCVNLSIPDSEWLYNFSSVGTLVNVHY